MHFLLDQIKCPISTMETHLPHFILLSFVNDLLQALTSNQLPCKCRFELFHVRWSVEGRWFYTGFRLLGRAAGVPPPITAGEMPYDIGCRFDFKPQNKQKHGISNYLTPYMFIVINGMYKKNNLILTLGRWFYPSVLLCLYTGRVGILGLQSPTKPNTACLITSIIMLYWNL